MSDWPKPDPDKVAMHNAANDTLQKKYKDIEEQVRSNGLNPWDDQAFKDAFYAWRSHYNLCRQCGSTNTSVYNHSLMWHDGDVVCDDCGRYVRMYDAG